jgi:DNA invertase Pin-like site-specific DNA recombinase
MRHLLFLTLAAAMLMPTASDAQQGTSTMQLTIHILAAVAQHEGEIISARTSAALQAAKARGKRLGNPKLSQARRHAEAAKKEIADRYSANILPVIREIQGSGVKSLRGVARALAARGIPTARGGAWTPVQVSASERHLMSTASSG